MGDGLDLSALQSVVPRTTLHQQTPPHLVAERIKGCEFVFVNKVRLDREVIEAATALRFIGLTATGVDNIDLHAARENQVAVCNIRAYCTQSVVEHVFAVLLQLTHNIALYGESVRQGHWQQAQNFCMLDFPIRELSAMTIGIVGYGTLGRGVADIAKAFGMRVLVARRIGAASREDDGRVDLDDLLRDCDVVSLHCPLTEQTRGMIGERELGLMRNDAILINTARGALVDSAALVEALRDGVIGAAAIDTLAEEPPRKGDPLLEYAGDNLIVTPHIAWATLEARQNAIDELAKNVAAFLQDVERNRV